MEDHLRHLQPFNHFSKAVPVAQYHNDVTVAGAQMSADEGILPGIEQADGLIPACPEKLTGLNFGQQTLASVNNAAAVDIYQDIYQGIVRRKCGGRRDRLTIHR